MGAWSNSARIQPVCGFGKRLGRINPILPGVRPLCQDSGHRSVRTQPECGLGVPAWAGSRQSYPRGNPLSEANPAGHGGVLGFSGLATPEPKTSIPDSCLVQGGSIVVKAKRALKRSTKGG